MLKKKVSHNIGNPETIGSFTAILEKAYKDEENLWRQRSRINWLQSGDRNTSFFHAATRNRRSQNRLTVLENEAGVASTRTDNLRLFQKDFLLIRKCRFQCCSGSY